MMRTFDAWHLPGLHSEELAFATYEIGALAVRAPALTPEQLHKVIAHTTAARDRVLLKADPTEIISAINHAAARIADVTTTHGAAARELLPAATGYSAETIADILDHMTRDWSADSLRVLLETELGPDVRLGDFQLDRRTARRVLVRGPRFAFHIFSGSVPGVAVTSVIRSLLVRAATLGKTASGEPVLPVIFAQALAAAAPHLAECIAITYWPGGNDELESVALQAADAVVVYGGSATVQSVAARARADARLVVHGPRLSIGIVGPAADLTVAPAIARATAAYDQQGCVSPHVVYVVTGGITPRELARAIAQALADLSTSLPRRAISQEEALAIREARTRAEFRDLAGAAAECFGPEDTSYTVIYDEDPALAVSCLNRVLYVKPVAKASELPALLAPHRDVLQSAALSGFTDAQTSTLARALAECGITRFTTFDELPWPRMWWHHDGRGPLRELLFWHDMER